MRDLQDDQSIFCLWNYFPLFLEPFVGPVKSIATLSKKSRNCRVKGCKTNRPARCAQAVLNLADFNIRCQHIRLVCRSSVAHISGKEIKGIYMRIIQFNKKDHFLVITFTGCFMECKGYNNEVQVP